MTSRVGRADRRTRRSSAITDPKHRNNHRTQRQTPAHQRNPTTTQDNTADAHARPFRERAETARRAHTAAESRADRRSPPLSAPSRTNSTPHVRPHPRTSHRTDVPPVIGQIVPRPLVSCRFLRNWQDTPDRPAALIRSVATSGTWIKAA
jgi:hypothetical protein